MKSFWILCPPPPSHFSNRWSLPFACDNLFLLAVSLSFFFFLFNAIPLNYYHVHNISVIERVEKEIIIWNSILNLFFL